MLYAAPNISHLLRNTFYSTIPMDGKDPVTRISLFLSEKMQISVNEMAFVGDEEKDILCASNAGVCSILINRDRSIKNYGQDKEIDSLDKLLKIVG